MRNIIRSILLISTMVFAFCGKAHAAVYGAGVIPMGPLYDVDGREYTYNQNTGEYMSGGQSLPAGHPLYDKRGQKGHVYYGNSSTFSSYAPTVSPGAAVGVLLGAILINAILQDSSTDAPVKPTEPTSEMPSEPRHVPSASPEIALTSYEQMQIDAKQMTVQELNTLQQVAYRRGIEPFIGALKEYCETQAFPYSINIFDGKISFNCKVNNPQFHPQFQNATFEYTFDTKINNASVTLRIPQPEIRETLEASYTEAIPQNLSAFGFTLTPEPVLYAGYEGYIVKDIRPYSKAAIIGLKQYDQIIKVGNISIKRSIDFDETLKEINTALYKDKQPITISYIRNGILEKTVLRP